MNSSPATSPDPFKVLLCHNFYKLAGGEDRVFEDEAKLLENHGHQVIRYTVSNDEIDTMSSWSAAVRTIWNRKTYAELRSLIREERPTVVHFTNTFPLISPAAYYAARKERVPVVQTLQNYRLVCPGALLMRDGQICEDCLAKRIKWPAVLHGCYRGNRLASACVTTMLATHSALGTWRNLVSRYVVATEFGRQKFIEAGFRAEQITVKPNFVASVPPCGKGDGGHFVFVGRLSPEKGINTLLEAWPRFGRSLKILGDGPLADKVAQFASQHEGVQWLGHQPPETVHQVVADAISLIVPSIWYEGLPKTIIEAFSVGTPIIGSDLGAMSEVITPGKTGMLFPAGDANKLLEALHQMSDSPERCQSMRDNVRQQFEQLYTAERNYDLLRDIYCQAIDEGDLL
ncbi:glycosyltransferase [Bythopirellula goksoeyrii]|uniref:Capsular glucan synthase n=1 Tax=Bythopirellula goksoeyrii TaxID=1400387 RepID=A0A5B9QL13_9BACT|nr:glycosyltransferase [Bythopirellula goksoeyrii]QEG34821.1 Capsular glucan synthase [Bythopirellula goksoeyrii]